MLVSACSNAPWARSVDFATSSRGEPAFDSESTAVEASFIISCRISACRLATACRPWKATWLALVSFHVLLLAGDERFDVNARKVELLDCLGNLIDHLGRVIDHLGRVIDHLGRVDV